MAVQLTSGPEGTRTLDPHNAIVVLSQTELQAHSCVACHPLIAHNGRDRRRLLDSAAQLPDEFRLRARRGRGAGFALSPAHCDDGVLLPFVAVGTCMGC